MRIAVEGCAHGELEIIYETIKEIEKADGKTVDLLICCGDFQSVRNLSDLKCMAVPEKFKDMCTFYKYYSGEKVAPILTIFIGGNHEASNYLQELPYGGWVAPNIYYLGYAGVVTIGGLRIAGLSGIYKGHDWMQGHHEKPPYTANTIRSVYHIRNLEVFRLKQLSGNINIFLSHDWPKGITKYGDEEGLLKKKPFFRPDIQGNILGSPPAMELLQHHYPAYWFSAHLHCKFAALVPEKDGGRATRFLALDKCLPQRKFLQVLEIEHNQQSTLKLQYDLEWLTILYLTNHLLSVKTGTHYMPGQGGAGRWKYTPTEKEKEMILKRLNNSLDVPLNFKQTEKAYNQDSPDYRVEMPTLVINDQTTEFCAKLGIDDPSALLQMMTDIRELKTNDTSDTLCQRRSNSSFSQEESILDSTLDESLTDSSLSQATSVDLISVKSDIESQEIKSSQEESTSVSVKDNLLPVASSSPTIDNTQHAEAGPNCKKFKRRNYAMYADNS